MSAIWGYIRKNNKRIEDCSQKMKLSYLECAIDRYEERHFLKGFFACGLQCFNTRSHKEVLPIYDESNGFVFTADIILNDRANTIDCILKELENRCHDNITRFLNGNVQREKMIEIPDGTIAYIAWLLWKERFIDFIQGIFSIAIYDINSEIVFLFSDHMGHRSLYYLVTDEEVYFSTIPRAIFEVVPKEFKGFNEKWITACEADNTPSMYLFPSLTPFKNIYQLCRGEYLEIDCSQAKNYKKKIVEYWKPDFNRKKQDTIDYKSRFLNTFTDCVRDAIDTDQNIAATLSSGLDSSSVSAIAARLLQDQNRNLYTFTSIPLKGYKNDHGDYYIADESAGVIALSQEYSNIIPEFTSYDDKSGFTEMRRLIHMTEVPTKAISNLVWVDDIEQKAKKKKCKVLLTGHFGNTTISSGGILDRVYEELLKGSLVNAKRQLAYYGKRHGITKKELLRGTLQQLKIKLLSDIGLNQDFNKCFDHKYINRELVKKYKVISFQRKTYSKYGNSALKTRKNVMNFVMDKAVSQNLNVYDTAFSLYYGVITRDPTRDKRMVELVGNMPASEFADNGIERRLVREYMKDYLPDSIRMEERRRGLQSADTVYRLGKIGESFVSKEKEAPVYHYFDYGEVQRLFGERPDKENTLDILRVMALDAFMKEFKPK